MLDRLQQTISNLIGRKGQNHLPMPGRGSMGMLPSWAQFLSSWNSRTQVVSPSDARDGKDNAIVSITINWIATTWQTAPPQVGRYDSAGKFLPTPASDLITLLQKPSRDGKGISGTSLLHGLIQDYVRKGNAYAHIVKPRAGAPIGLDYLPAKFVKAVPDALGRLMHYEYQANGESVIIPPAEILHFRHGVDEDNPLQGISPIAAQYREIVADNAYSDTTASMAANGAVQTVIFTPKQTADGIVQMTGDEAAQISNAYAEHRQKNPGRTPFLPGSLDMHKVGLTPSEMALNDVRAMPETRIPAALGIPAILLQLYTGIQKSTYNNLHEAIQQGWRGGIIPIMRIFEGEVNVKLLPLFAGTNSLTFRYNTDVVPELQDDTLAMREADREDVKAGILTADEARSRQGLGAKPIEAQPDPAQEEHVQNRLSLRRKFYGHATRKASGAEPLLSVYAAADRYRRALAADEAAALDLLATEWARTQAALGKRTESLFAFMADQEARGFVPSEWRQDAIERLLSLSEQIDAEMQSLADRGAAIVEDGQRSAILTTTEHIGTLARSAAGVPPTGATFPFSVLPADTFEALIGLASDGSPLSALLAKFATDEGYSLRQALLDGIVAGENPRKVAARFAMASNSSRARLEAIARTEMLRAARESTRRNYSANGDVVSGYVRLSAADTRVCVSCWALHGTVSLNSEIMPTHPNCRCAMVPQVRSWAEITGDPTMPDTREPIPMGEELFAMLPESDKLEVLGPGRMALYQDGQSLLSLMEVNDDPQWGPTTRIKPLAEVNQ